MLRYSFAEKGDEAMLKDLWLSSFDDKGEAVDMFIKEYFSTYNTLVCKDGKKVVSALYLIDCKFFQKEKIYDIYYIYAAATHMRYRKQGIMGKLIMLAHEIGKQRGKYAVALIPQNKGIEAFYEKYGYKNYFKARTFSLDYKGAQKFIEFNTSEAEVRRKFVPYNSVLWENKHFDFIKVYYRNYGGGIVRIKNAYAIISYSDKNVCEISEFFSAEKDFNFLFSAVAHKFPSKKYIFTTSENIFLSHGSVSYKGMIKFISEKADSLDLSGGYLGAAFE